MNRAALSLLLFLGALGCGGSIYNPPLNLLGTHDMVLVDELPSDGSIATVTNGVPNQYLFVTSADRNELKVMKNSSSTQDMRLSVKAPDPLETLSIPVLTRPTALFADESLSPDGRRVTGRFIYAIRTGGAELSVIDATPAGFAQVTKDPLVLPAPITAGAAWMGFGLTSVPDTTSVYLATYDGANGAVYRLTLPTDAAHRAQVATATPQHLMDVGSEPIVALAIVPPLDGRTLDGKPFCGLSSKCIVIATRSASGKAGRTLMVDVETLKTAALAFPGPVRTLRVATSYGFLGRRIHGLLDEEKCDSVSCGGALVIDTLTGTSSAGFPVLTDFSGKPMLPVVRTGVLARDLAVAAYHDPTTDAGLEGPLGIRQYSSRDDGGIVQGYYELGMFSASNGEIIVYDGLNGVPADYNGERTGLLKSTTTNVVNVVRIPGQVSDDGGLGFFYDDGGAAYTQLAMALEDQDVPADDGGVRPYRKYGASVTYPNGVPATFEVQLGDGYLFSQNILVANQGTIPDLVGLPTSPDAGQAVGFAPGLEARLAVGDRVGFSAALADGGTEDCGEAHVRSLGAGTAQLDAIPNGCESRSLFTIRGAGSQPIIVSGEIEGYIGRGAEKEKVTYNRRYVAMPAGYDNQGWPALEITLDAMPTEPGAYWLFAVDGALNPYRIQFDFSDAAVGSVASGCATQVPGALTLAEVPTNSSTAGFSYMWNLITLFPYSSGIAYDPLQYTVANAFGSRANYGLGAMCYR